MTGRVLVAGGTGRLGTLVVAGLAARGIEVRVLTRDPRRAAHLAASGVPGTIVRATAFLELWIDLLTSTAGRSNRPLVFGRGRNPVNFVSVRDVAALVERVVTDQEPPGRTLEIGGPDILSYEQLIQIMARARGLRRRVIVPVPVLTPFLSSLWIHLVTPVNAHMARPLAEGLACGRIR